MKDHNFMILDNELYSLIQTLIENDIELNEDPKIFNRYCYLRDLIESFINNVNRSKTRREKWKI